MLEVHNEKITDLLNCKAACQRIAFDPEAGVTVPEASKILVTSAQHCMELLSTGQACRSVAATACNTASSRSHCIVCLHIEAELHGGGVHRGKLSLVDLAGSERQAKTGAQGALLAEGGAINSSLLCLERAVGALADGHRHVPFRDSKLTRVLQDTIGGNAHTAIIVCCSPDASNAHETLSTLRFGSRAQGITSNVQRNETAAAEPAGPSSQAVVASAVLHAQEAALHGFVKIALGTLAMQLAGVMAYLLTEEMC
jgi:hypothetical protein